MASFHNRMAEFFKTYGLLFGRLALVVIFFTSGVNHVRNFPGSVATMQGKLPALPEPLIQILLVGAILFLFAGTLLVALGLQARMGAMLLFVFLLVVTPLFHNFWAVPEDAIRLQSIQFQKNLAIAGGLWILMAAGPGPFAFDRPREQSRRGESG